ncbi:hypothetical protein E2C01_056452 [Portunus trituberculatus]|uniref:Uncharacterized protein n=1 Tax=Portunus trituberculatus TaxID=210409 RepID=A0A5B7GZ70_PORTR|nr:hypothetical protein [Portunus trituberculatus]
MHLGPRCSGLIDTRIDTRRTVLGKIRVFGRLPSEFVSQGVAANSGVPEPCRAPPAALTSAAAAWRKIINARDDGRR